MTKVQPMKMASAEALYETKSGAGLSLFALGGLEKSPDKLAYNLEIPGLLSFITPTASPGPSRASTTSRRSTRSATDRATTCRCSV
jgi:cytochrome bd-type quinol oxidase subunit 1